MNDPSNEKDLLNNEPEISQSPGLSGIQWVGQSFSLFSRNPSIWIVMLIIYFGISYLLTTLPILVLLPTLLAPAFTAGFVYGAREVDNGKMLEIDHLFAGFKLQLRGLFRLGMLYFLANLIIIIVVSITLESIANEAAIMALSEAITSGAESGELEKILIQNPDLIPALLKSLMVGFVLSIPLIMASWFAPTLVMFHQLTPIKAMLLSIKACNQNMLAFLVFGLLMLPLLLLAVLPLGLGLLIILPVIFISQYCSYKAVFNEKKSDRGVFLV